MPSTHDKIASVITSSNATTVSFTSIPTGFTDLFLTCTFGTSNTGNNAVYIEFNSDAYTNNKYYSTRLWSNGTSLNSSRRSNDPSYITDGLQVNGSVNQTLITININNYSNSTNYKQWMSRGSNAAQGIELLAGMWEKTEAISTVTLKNLSSYYFIDGSIFNLYGIKAA